ncbi:tetratricopeptide repeat protein, partial [Candidatus Dependentiae bacterium]|nr:tetratricopeptide repeat protein [Candidatus Dependentiae bacterium]
MRRNLIKLFMVSLLVTLLSVLSWSVTAKQMWNQGRQLLKQKNYSEAVTALEKAVELDEGNLVYLNWLGQAYLLNKQYQEALGSFEKVKEKASVLVWNYPYGLALLKTGKVDEAIVALEKAKKLKKFSASKINQALGQCYYEKKDFEKSEELIKNSLKVDPTLPGNKMYLGMIYLQRNEYLKADEEFKNEIKLSGDDLEERKSTIAKVLVEFGYKNISEGKFNEGEDLIKSALTFNAEISKKGLIEGYIKEADYLLSQGKPSEAKEKLEAALELDPGNTNIKLKLDAIKGTDLKKYIVPVAGGIVGVVIVFIILIVIIKSSKKKKQAAAESPPESQPVETTAPPVAEAPKQEEQVTEVVEGIEEKAKE